MRVGISRPESTKKVFDVRAPVKTGVTLQPKGDARVSHPSRPLSQSKQSFPAIGRAFLPSSHHPSHQIFHTSDPSVPLSSTSMSFVSSNCRLEAGLNPMICMHRQFPGFLSGQPRRPQGLRQSPTTRFPNPNQKMLSLRMTSTHHLHSH
jgi:hypothetical protein